jgi:hypothetical protein
VSAPLVFVSVFVVVVVYFGLFSAFFLGVVSFVFEAAFG